MIADLKARMCRLLDVLADAESPDATQAFESLLARTGELWRRKQTMEGTKRDTQDLLSEVVFSRLRRAFKTFHEDADPSQVLRSAEWVMGVLFSGAALAEFANAVDRAILESGSGQQRDFSFAGRTTFISIQEVLQLLGSGGYTGMLAIEKEDNRLDVFILDGKVAFFDPHHLVRRMLPGHDNLHYREIPSDLLKQAEILKGTKHLPLLLGLVEQGYLREDELPELLQNLGLEVFYEFLNETGACTFFYKKLEAMPDFVRVHNLSMPVTPILLEGSKRTDEWLVMLEVFPNPDQPLKPVPDMFAKIDGLPLGVHEIKLLATVNRGSSPRQLANSIGLPLFDVYQHLVRYARDGIVEPLGRSEALSEVVFTLEETMEKAFEMLDANDDSLSKERALEDALGDPFAGPLAGGDGTESFLDILASKDAGASRK